MKLKVHEDQARRAARRQGLLLRKSRRDGTYVLVQDSAGNRMPGAAAARNQFDRGQGMSLDDVFENLRQGL